MILSGKDYHFETSYDRHRMKGHGLDWPNQPDVFKTYDGIRTISLPDVEPVPETSLWTLTGKQEQSRPDAALSLDRLSKVFALSDSLTARSRLAGGDFFFRSVASAGALYPNELYLGAYTVEGLENGIYHYDIRNRTLTPLRSGIPGRMTQEAIAESKKEPLSACFYITGIFFRSAWKYRARAFRYVLLDAGHLLENLLLALKALGIPFSIHYDFDDMQMGKLLGIDGKREVCLACVTIPGEMPDPVGSVAPSASVEDLPERFQEASSVSGREIPYEEIINAYQAGTQPYDKEESDIDLSQNLGVSTGSWENLVPWNRNEAETQYPEVIFSRRSKRNYIDQTLSKERFTALLNLVTSAFRQDLPPKHRYASALTVGFLTGNIEETTPGFYLLDPVNNRYGQVSTGYMTYKMASVCLDQDWLRGASIHFLFLTDLERIDSMWGPRS